MTIGVGRAAAPPPSEPDRRFSRIRLSSWWFTSARVDHTARGRQTKRTALAQQRMHWADCAVSCVNGGSEKVVLAVPALGCLPLSPPLAPAAFASVSCRSSFANQHQRPRCFLL